MRTILGTREGKSWSLRTPPGMNSPVVGDTRGTRSPREVRTTRATSSWAEEPVLSVARRRELGSPSWHVGHPKVTAALSVLTGQRELRYLHFMGFRDNKEPPCPWASVCTHKSALVLLSPSRLTPKMLPPSRRDAPKRTARL